MAELLLGPMLRWADATSATIWVETSSRATVEVLGATASTFCVHGHHYALVMVEGLDPGLMHEYDVRIDGRVVWPEPDSDFPASVIRTIPDDREDIRVVFGSCRAAAPHEDPYTLEKLLDPEGRGVDALWAHAERMRDLPPEQWPHLALFIGDQVYADDSSPTVRERIERRRPDHVDLPPEIVAGFEEFCWLYHESWSLPSERWFFSTVPSAMIFDDHDMIDDWNISSAWVDEMRHEPWWTEHAVGALMSYWIHQHLGNLSPAAIRDDGLLARLVAADDATPILRAWAESCEGHDGADHPQQRFSFVRRTGTVHVVVIDSRHNRQLAGGERRMISSGEWAWVREQALACDGHLVLCTSMPVFIADGLHDFQVWSERVCDGVWGAWAASKGERLRRALDLEDWSAFHASYLDVVALLRELGSRELPLRSIVLASGDIHFSYAARVPLAEVEGRPVWQVVSSPIRNALIPPERGVMRFTLSRPGRLLGSVLRRLARAPDTRPHVELAAGPLFANNLGVLDYDGDRSWLSIEHDEPDDEGRPTLAEIPRVRLT